MLTSRDLARSQGVISKLREGDELEVDVMGNGSRRRFLAGGQLVAVLSEAGQTKLDALTRRLGGTLRAKVHEVFVHTARDKNGDVTGRWLVTLPAIRVGRGDGRLR